MAGTASLPITGTTVRDEARDIARVATFLGLVVLAALILNIVYAVWAVGVRFGGCLGWALALALVGILVGFLFGIPRVLQHSGRAAPAAQGGQGQGQAAAADASNDRDRDYEQRVNTNLEEISDWLTKIIVGLGLVQLKEVPSYIVSLANTIAPSLGEITRANVSAAAAMAVFYPVAGFLFGYLVTRLYVQGAFARADVDATKYALHADVDVRVAALEAGQSLAIARAGAIAAVSAGGGATATAAAASRADPKQGLAELTKLGDEYMSVKLKDYSDRLQKKNELADAMYRVVRTYQIPKQDLAQRRNEPFLLALALAVIASPEYGDLEWILNSTAKLTRSHVRYQTVIALATLSRANLIGRDDRPRVLELLKQFRMNADEPLLRQISSLEALVNA